eukprot:568562-Pyramimonas_sp.AAC.1
MRRSEQWEPPGGCFVWKHTQETGHYQPNNPASSPLCTPPKESFAPAQRHLLVPRSFRHLGRHGNGKSASATCPRWLTSLFALGSLGGSSLLRHRSFLGALPTSACVTSPLCWEPCWEELVASPLS